MDTVSRNLEYAVHKAMVLSWWLWVLLGILLLVLELMTPGGFYVLFFGVGAIVVGLLTALGITGSPAMQWLLFGLLSVALLLMFRKPLQRRSAAPQTHEVDAIAGEIAVAMGTIGLHQLGKCELRGTAWNARNIGDSVITPGQRCRVERVDGLTLDIRG